MAIEQAKLNLGKGAAFVKSRLKRLRQEDDTWEADFRPLPKAMGQTDREYLGLVVALPKGNPLVYLPLQYTPSFNDLADLLANAMRRPVTGEDHRPRHIHFRGNPRWEELFPHLKEIDVEVSIQDELPKLEVVFDDFLRQMRKAGSGPMIVFFPGPPPVDEQFSAIAKWVQEWGWIEVGQQNDSGFVVRALDFGGLVFEDDKPRTFAEALAALENGLKGWFSDQGTD
jgi:uncharacterized protein DUF6930